MLRISVIYWMSKNFFVHIQTNEESLLIQLAKQPIVSQPTGKSFTASTGISTRGTSLIIKKFENEAIIYRTKLDIVLANPLLKEYLVHFR